MSHELVYSSDFIIRSSLETATLSVFCERTYLPYWECPSDPDDLFAVNWVSSEMPWGGWINPVWYRSVLEQYAQWQQAHRMLFDENVFVRLPPSEDFEPPVTAPDSYEEQSMREDFYRRILDEESLLPKPMLALTNGSATYVPDSFLSHLYRTDIEAARVFVTYPNRPPRDVLVAFEAREVFRYLLPVLGPLEPEQLLQVREKVKDTREGFSMHLQKLSKAMDAHAQNGCSTSDLAYFARGLIETELMPDFREFRRQLAAERAGFWANVLDKAGKVFEIDAAPVTPKFWGDLLKALGFTGLAYAAGKKQALSNVQQAFQFMGVVEDRLA